MDQITNDFQGRQTNGFVEGFNETVGKVQFSYFLKKHSLKVNGL
jgi:hypothetical protein